MIFEPTYHHAYLSFAITQIHTMYFLPLGFLLMVGFRQQVVLSISIFNNDDLDSDSLLFDDNTTQPSSFWTEDNDLSTTTTTADATLSNPCVDAAQDDLSLAPEGPNLFSRENNLNPNPACLPPVNIGAEASQLFDDPLGLLEKNIYPWPQLPEEHDHLKGPIIWKEDDENPQPYKGPVFQGNVDDESPCRKWTLHKGNYDNELCCDDMYIGYTTRSQRSLGRMAQIDAETIANQEIAVIYRCECTFFVCLFFGLVVHFFFLVFFSFKRGIFLKKKKTKNFNFWKFFSK